ncbi:hypothetical protein CALCODRAFT_500508 [Calocera cornea HHB12733]|uniref:F-box domain-containing protein n=1 Tax=Calocera cornea HHB12733 TaxID=1353952 RepID=A0A165E291_9BASI|nr:hypothetical protein CALCODRAFT_500508 [Calocera cornea HHB12733]
MYALEYDLHALMHGINETRNMLLSPIYRLNDDIFEEIFRMCTFRDPRMDVMRPADVDQVTSTPLAISWVSRRWRSVALQTTRVLEQY